MAPTTATKRKQQQHQQLAQLSPPPPQCLCSPSQDDDDVDDGDDVARQLVMGRWRSSLSSGLRAALACTIVGLVSLHAPAALRRHITFPAFSYVVTVILVTDATLGTALRGAASALHGTLMGAAPSVAALWLAHRVGAAESVAATSAVVALTAFAVALPEDSSSSSPVAKRIALGQAIIVYVARFQQGERPSRDLALLHPANVVACTALGAAAALLAVLLPWPRLATREARDKRSAYRLVAAERVRVLADAFVGEAELEAAACVSGQRRWRMAARVSEANRRASASTTLNRINAIKEDLQWERAAAVVDDNMSSIEMPLTGMQMALATMQQAQAKGRHPEPEGRNNDKNMVVGLVTAMRDQIRLALLTPNKQRRQSTRSLSFSGFGSSCCSTATPSSKSLYQLPSSTSYDEQQLAPSLFIFSLYQLHRRCCGGDGPETPLTAAAAMPNAKQVAPATTTMTGQELLLEQPADLLPDDEQEVDEQVGQDDPSSQAAEAATATAAEDKSTTTKQQLTRGPSPLAACLRWRWPRRRRLVAAAKCGFSLGLAVLLGLLFSNDHGFWSGLIVATTMTAGRQSTWAVAVARAHGTALGSIYGVLCCQLMPQQQRLLTMDLRFVALLPWMVLAAFLKRSRAYGPAGGVAAALSVVIIEGRRYDEAPMAFTIARLVETFIGISCAVLADLVFQPGARPSVQAREQLHRCIAALAEHCCSPVVVAENSSSELFKRVQQELALLSKYAAEAGSEPTYLWLPPFPAACYDKIQGSLGRMAQLLQLYHQACRHQQQQQVDVDDDTNTNTIQQQRRRFSSLASTSLSHCLHMLAPPQKPKGQVVDLEAGGIGCSCCDKDDEVVASILAQARDAKLLLLNDDDDNDDSVQQQEERLLLVCCLGSIALCMGEILKEARRLEAHILDLNNLQLRTH